MGFFHCCAHVIWDILRLLSFSAKPDIQQHSKEHLSTSLSPLFLFNSVNLQFSSSRFQRGKHIYVEEQTEHGGRESEKEGKRQQQVLAGLICALMECDQWK